MNRPDKAQNALSNPVYGIEKSYVRDRVVLCT